MTITGGGVVAACALAAERMTRYAPKHPIAIRCRPSDITLTSMAVLPQSQSNHCLQNWNRKR